jgi:dihydroorotate dehydrogenase electron transfer subunit
MTRAVDAFCTVRFRRELGPGLFRLAVEAPAIARRAKPGQFVQVKVSPGLDPLLRRPMSIAGVNGQRIEMLFEVVGKGTRALSERRVGERLSILGPLGKGFTGHERAVLPVLIGGGIGVPPLLFLARRMGRKGRAFLGARTGSLLFGESQLRRLGWKVEVSTDDGTRGYKGLVSEIFAKSVQAFSQQAVVFSCGPLPMLKKVARLCAHKGLACEVSLEAMMACGMGVCRGCVVPAAGGNPYLDICREGPVLDARKVDWDKVEGFP